MKRAKEKLTDSEKHLFEQYYGLYLWYCKTRGVTDTNLLLYDETFYRCIKEFDQSKEPGFSTYLIAALRNTTSNVRRTISRREPMRVGYSFYQTIPTVPIEDTVESKLNIDVFSDLFLTDREKYILKKYQEGYTSKEIATFCGVTKRNVNYILQKIRSKYLEYERSE